MKIDIIAGARPNFMKIGPIIHAIHRHNAAHLPAIEYRLIHTGQHYDQKMSDSFFEQLNIPQPNINLGVGSGSAATQTGNIMMRYEAILDASKPDLCIVVGDVTSTMACSIVAKKAWVKVAHVEGGIRSGDMTMPEEVNRMVTDSITDYFFTTSEVANENLKQQGIGSNQIFFVGNTMIDSLLANLDRLQQPDWFNAAGLLPQSYIVATLHRPSNVDNPDNLRALLQTINDEAGDKKIVFPMHPRTKKIYEGFEIELPNMHITDPMPYLEFIFMIKNAIGVITDSGGITEETTVLKVPCMTLRDSTERPETVTIGTNEMVGTNIDHIAPFMRKMLSGDWKKGGIPPLWDGNTADRIVAQLVALHKV